MRGRAAFRGGGNGPRIIHNLPARPVELSEEGQLSGTSDSESDSSESSSSNSDSSSDSDMDPTADAVSSKLPPAGSRNGADGEEMGIQGITIPDKVSNTQALESSSSAFPSSLLPAKTCGVSANAVQRRQPRRHVAAPPKAPNNHFSRTSRRPLLRNLLEPEVHVTLSNLSQAIRFIVANDCLRNVELKPGDAEDECRKSEKVRVVGGTTEQVLSVNDGDSVDNVDHTIDGARAS